MSNLWATAAAFQLRQLAAEEEYEEPYEEPYMHVSPHFMRPGTELKPPGKGWTNFEQSSGEHNYVTRSHDTAEEISHHLWEQGHNKIHWYDVEPKGEVEPDEMMEQSFRTKDPVEVLQRSHVIRRHPVYRSPAGKEWYGPGDEI
jgi:hypothetical protein